MSYSQSMPEPWRAGNKRDSPLEICVCDYLQMQSGKLAGEVIWFPLKL